jgi:hypothetical protein
MKKYILILFVFSLISCDNPVEPEYQQTHISGTVTDWDEGFPLDSAIVFLYQKDTHINGQSVWSETIRIKEVSVNAEGFYSMYCEVLGNDKYAEMYWMGAERKGYQTRDLHTGELVGRGQVQKIDIKLRKSY